MKNIRYLIAWLIAIAAMASAVSHSSQQSRTIRDLRRHLDTANAEVHKEREIKRDLAAELYRLKTTPPPPGVNRAESDARHRRE